MIYRQSSSFSYNTNKKTFVIIMSGKRKEHNKMSKNNALSDELLKDISGGVLPKGWQQVADNLAPGFIKQYPDITYEQACLMIDTQLVGKYGVVAEDGVLVKEYLKKYFGADGKLLPQYLK